MRFFLCTLYTSTFFSLQSFVKRVGTTDLGKEYEDLNVGNVVLTYATDPEVKFSVSSNDKDFGAFDDIVVKFEKEIVRNYALQLKHVKSGSMRNKLSSPKGDFSIEKYFKDFVELQKKRDITSFKFIVFTNHKFEVPDKPLYLLNDRLVVDVYKDEQRLFEISKSGECFKFRINKESSDASLHSQDYDRFFERYFLYANQDNVDDTKTRTLQMFRNKFRCNNEIGELYLNFIREWSKTEGKKRKLDREFVTQAVALILLGPVMKPFVPVTSKTSKNELLKKVILEFDVTVVSGKSVEKVQEIGIDLDGELGDFETFRKKGTQFQIVTKDVERIEQLDESAKSKLLWLFGKFPLIVEANETTYQAMNLCPTKKYILVTEDVHQDRLKNFTVLDRLSSLDQTSDIYKNVLSTFECRLKEKKITLKDLLTRNSKIHSVITTNELVQMAADSFKMADVVRLLVLSDPNMASLCRDGYTPIHVACLKGETQLVELIADSDIDVKAASKDGDTPVYLASLHGHHDVVELLVACKADVSAANKDGDTPLLVACSKGDFTLVKILCRAGVNQNGADKDGTAPLQIACSNGNYDIVESLLDNGANVDGANKNGETGMYLAALNGHSEIVKLLLDRKCRNVSNGAGNTALHAACQNGHHQVVEEILQFVQDNCTSEGEEVVDEDFDLPNFTYMNVNAGNVKGNTPLHLACAKGHTKVVEILKDRADVSIRNGQGFSPLDLATKYGHCEVVSLLQ
jgi:ankyrin repeat protein